MIAPRIVVAVSVSLIFQVAHADTQSEIDRLFRQASSGEVRFTKLVQPSKDSLAAMKDTAAKYLIQKLTTSDAREKLTLTEIYRGVGVVATPYLVAALQTENKDQLKTTCRCLAEVKDSTAVEPLLKITKHSDYTVRSEAVTAIGKSGGSQTAEKIEPAIADPISEVRKSCAAALGRLKSKSSAPLLMKALEDDNFSVRLAAFDALVACDSLATPSIMAMLEDRKADAVTFSLIMRLAGLLRLTEAQYTVEWYINSENPILRGWAIWSYGRIMGKAAEDRIKGIYAPAQDPFVRSLLAETITYLDTLSTHE